MSASYTDAVPAFTTTSDGVSGGDNRPIGVFDSGAGGLTVARALMDLLPDERLLYVGDTARGPYGPRDLAEVRGFTRQIVEWLELQDVKLIVAACNTATAAAYDEDPLIGAVQVVGVIEPAVRASVAVTRSGRIGMIGTAATVASGAYDRAMQRRDGDFILTSQACPRFVSFVEQGRTVDTEVLQTAERYLAPVLHAGVDTLILGCTHYPFLTGVIGHVMGSDVTLISSAESSARAVFSLLMETGQMADHQQGGAHRYSTTGDAAFFAGLSLRFLGPRVTHADVLPLPAPIV